jgi:hypothetical protein
MWGPSWKHLSFDSSPTQSVTIIYYIGDQRNSVGNEMIVNVHTNMNKRRATEPTLSHFLLLIVAGELRGVHVSRSSQELTAEPKKRYKRSSSPPNPLSIA